MKYFNHEVKCLGQAPSTESDMLHMIERAGRTCYKSEDKMTQGSATTFFKNIFKSGHFSVIEHSNIVYEFKHSDDLLQWFYSHLMFSGKGSYFRIHEDHKSNTIYVAANLRAWLEFFSYCKTIEWCVTPFRLLLSVVKRDFPFIMEQWLNAEMADDKEIAWMNCDGVKLVDSDRQLELHKQSNWIFDLPVFVFVVETDRGITHELVRNRALSFSQESTRYVNYLKKLGLHFYPVYNDMLGEESRVNELWNRVNALHMETEEVYNLLVADPGDGNVPCLKPQIARDILPNALRAEIVLSGRWSYGNEKPIDLSSGWCHFLRQRCSMGAHPHMRIIGNKIKELFASNFNI